MMREQLVRQLKQELPLIDTIAQDVLRCHDDLMQAQAALETAKATSPSRMKKTGSLLGIGLMSPVDVDQARDAEREAEAKVAESNTRLADLTKRARHHIHHVGLLVHGVQQTTVSIVEGILDWRQLRQRRQLMSNFQRTFRFSWRRKKVANYLLHLDDDLRSLFHSAALELLLGPKATYNPLLLSRTTIQILGVPPTGKTFLTERDCSNMSKNPSTNISPESMKQCCINSAGLKRLQEVLANAINSSEGPSSPVKLIVQADHDRLRRCLAAIYQENELEALEKHRFGEEERRVQSAYDPFSTIKSAGGVEETLSNILQLLFYLASNFVFVKKTQIELSYQQHGLNLPRERSSPGVFGKARLGEQLRIRQEDTNRAAVPAAQPQSTSREILHINTDRLREFLEKRAALFQPVADCELRDIQKWGMKNKLQGKIMVRKNNEKRVEHVHARKIQLQYLAHRQRNSLLFNLTSFVRNVQVSAINIQRVFRGHRAKCDFASMRSAWLEHNRRISAVRTIINSFRRYRRRQRHRVSMTVESIAQSQLITLLQTKLNEGTDQDTTERYRRVGEERRRQRIVLLQKHKMEQQEIERKRVAAAIRMQSVVRAHLAQGQAKILRQEKKAHMNAVSAMAIQSTIRKFLNVQQERRRRFRKDLERVNQSAVRIQSIYRGYNSRASLLGQLDEQTRRRLETEFAVNTLHEGDPDDENDEVDDEDEDEDESSESVEEDELEDQSGSASIVEKTVVVHEALLPPIAASISRGSSTRSSSVGMDEKPAFRSRTPTPSVSLPPLWNRDGSSSSLVSSTSSSSTARRISIGMMRVELKLKDAELGDNFDTPPSRHNSFMGNMRQQT
ncbi:hypothetical protein PHMEG_00013069 [Phytophthora megakarya]|uniref:Uncharacterized protein n=1 Tax=Phytophthora megakarya TaxID=4795 RepID=A0A225W7N5_9STRA|nr:hypothetical protein PHMEG_00013069 [Phytophthora megakarya]